MNNFDTTFTANLSTDLTDNVRAVILAGLMPYKWDSENNHWDYSQPSETDEIELTEEEEEQLFEEVARITELDIDDLKWIALRGDSMLTQSEMGANMFAVYTYDDNEDEVVEADDLAIQLDDKFESYIFVEHAICQAIDDETVIVTLQYDDEDVGGLCAQASYLVLSLVNRSFQLTI